MDDMTYRQKSSHFANCKRQKTTISALFSPLAIVQWNALPEDVVSSPSLDIFKVAVGKLQHIYHAFIF